MVWQTFLLQLVPMQILCVYGSHRASWFTKWLRKMKLCKRCLDSHWKNTKREAVWTQVRAYINLYTLTVGSQLAALFWVTRSLLGKKELRNPCRVTVRNIFDICQIKTLNFPQSWNSGRANLLKVIENNPCYLGGILEQMDRSLGLCSGSMPLLAS